MTVTIEYQCADGTPFPVTFADEEAASKRWVREREHSPDPLTPLGQDSARRARAGAEAAYAEVNLPMPPAFLPGPRAHGFVYSLDQLIDENLMAQYVAGCAALIAAHGSALGIWHDYCLPRVKEAVAFLDASDGDRSLAELSVKQEYGQQMTMIPAFVCGNDLELLKAVCDGVVEGDATLAAYELTQGYPCETLRADAEMWKLAQIAREDDAVMAALGSESPAAAVASFASSGSSSRFFTAVDAFLEQFGARAEGWDTAKPTWNERRDGLWRQIAAIATSADAIDPDVVLDRAAARRIALTTEIETKLATDPDALARFRRRLERAVPYVAVREERAHWQLILSGALRHAMFRRGDRLVELGVIDDREDVLYLTGDEFDEPPTSSLRDAVVERREERQRWLTASPPFVVGGETPRSAPGVRDADRVVRGVGASRGTATGRARVITDLADAFDFEPGDVLVCTMTSPPWTPLFAIAAAVVADSGSLGSHPAIAAREYGIPCVLDTKIATAVIEDGVTVMVDGEKGLVEVQP